MAGVRREKRQSHYPMRTMIFLVIEWVIPITPLDDVDRKHFEWGGAHHGHASRETRLTLPM
eukprot:scaffold189715_cov102-Attheya_sp.AAC.1